ncbi:MAG: DNA primase [Deltaproteobacteria bacterium]|nr:DNA primase [Deltaproteobacteria bacterium]
MAEVRERTSIVAVVSDYVTLRKAGHASFKGLCPFHSEKSPSFHVHEDRQFFYCFGCQTGGDAITFLREINGYSFVEALKHLADRAGIALPEPDRRGGPQRGGGPRAPRVQKETRDAFYEVGKLAQRYFAETLVTMEGSGCRDYLRGRGITKPAIERFGLGFAPDRWDGLLGTLKDDRADLRVAEALGLIVPRDGRDGHYDRFRNRLMFPIRSIAGEVIAFGGRTLSTEKDVAKYVNSPDSPVYQKGDTLFGLYEARQAIRKESVAIVVEGNLDLVRLHQEGIENTIAPMGTALTEAQCRLIHRFAARVVLLYDGDNAGRAAAEKALPLALAEGLHVTVATLPDGEDPDSFIGSRGVDGLREVIANATPGFEHLVIHCVLPRLGARPGKKGAALAAREVAPVLDLIRDPAERALYQRQLGEILGLDELDLVRLLGDGSRRGASVSATPSPPTTPAAPSTPPPPRELKLLMLLLIAPAATSLYVAHDIGELVTHRGVRDAADRWAALQEEDSDADIGSFAASIDDPSLREEVFKNVARVPVIADWAPDFDTITTGLRQDAHQRRLDALNQDLRRALMVGDDALAGELQMEKWRLARQLESLRATRS